MRKFLLFILLLAAVCALAQPDDSGAKNRRRISREDQKTLLPYQVSGGRMQMLTLTTGKSVEDLMRMYGESPVTNFGLFVCTVMVSHDLGLDAQEVLGGLGTATLGQRLQNMGIAKATAVNAIWKAVHLMVAAERAPAMTMRANQQIPPDQHESH